MTPSARLSAAIEILDAWLDGAPLERAATAWARRSRFAGSGDRAAIRDIVYDAARRRRSCAAAGGGADGRALVLGLLRQEGRDPAALFTGGRHAPPPVGPGEHGRPPRGAEALDVPDWLLSRMEAALGARTNEVLETLRHRAPVHLRVNTRRTTREEVRDALIAEGIGARLHHEVKTALEVTENARKVGTSRVLSDGLAELQDAHSQAVALRLAEVEPRRVLDYCAGGGGKALALADLTGARITAHDVEAGRMADLPRRAARAGVAIGTVAPGRAGPAAPFDLVLCDVPCSGSGAWRRDPEGKWRLSPERLEHLCRLQEKILAEGAALTAPGGRLALVTCSLLREENEARLAAFLAARPGWRAEHEARLDPGPAGDGFYLGLLRAPA